MKVSEVFPRLFGYMGRYRIIMALSILFSAAAAVMNLGAFVCVYYVAREIVISTGDFTQLNPEHLTDLGILAVILISSAFGVYGIALLFSHLAAYNTVANIRIKLVEHIGSLPLGYHATNPSGRQRKIVEKTTDNLEVLMAHQIPDIAQSVVLPFAFLVFMFLYDWRLSLVCLAPLVLGFAILASMLKGASESLVTQYEKSAEDISNAATEYVRGISVVKVFGQTAHSFKRYRAAVQEYSDYVIKYALSMENADSAYNTTINGIFFFLVPAGIILFTVSQGAEQVILSFVFFAVLIPSVVTILMRIMKSSSNLMIAQSSLETIDTLFAKRPLEQAKLPKTPASYDITLNHVNFSYGEAGEPALIDVSLEMKQGTITALVGESGGGKSTVANLIARFWDVSRGSIFVGGVDIRDIDYTTWMDQLSIVFQDTALFKRSLLDNVLFCKPEATRKEALAALSLAQCDDIVEKLPQGADTIIGTEGVHLSGGEMQRITLARAILKDAPVVLLDEATAFADAENEHLIQKALDELLRNKTVLMIAHRLSTIIHADQICVLQQGRIVEKGVHRQLLEDQGIYAHLYKEYQSSISWRIRREHYA